MTHRTGIEISRRASSPQSVLPPATTKRWVVRRKAEVVAAVAEGVLSLEEACERYALTVDELRGWQTFIERHGLAGLRVTRLQDYRAKHRRSGAFAERRSFRAGGIGRDVSD